MEFIESLFDRLGLETKKQRIIAISVIVAVLIVMIVLIICLCTRNKETGIVDTDVDNGVVDTVDEVKDNPLKLSEEEVEEIVSDTTEAVSDLVDRVTSDPELSSSFTDEELETIQSITEEDVSETLNEQLTPEDASMTLDTAILPALDSEGLIVSDNFDTYKEDGELPSMTLEDPNGDTYVMEVDPGIFEASEEELNERIDAIGDALDTLAADTLAGGDGQGSGKIDWDALLTFDPVEDLDTPKTVVDDYDPYIEEYDPYDGCGSYEAYVEKLKEKLPNFSEAEIRFYFPDPNAEVVE